VRWLAIILSAVAACLAIASAIIFVATGSAFWLFASATGFLVLGLVLLAIDWLTDAIDHFLFPQGMTQSDGRGNSVALPQESVRKSVTSKKSARSEFYAASMACAPWQRLVISHSFWLVPVIAIALWAAGILILPPVTLGVVGIVAFILSFATDHYRRRTMAIWDAWTLLRVHRCGSCGYDLAASPCDRDGCTVCSECGAAWRLEGGARHSR
jgi:hypothetical protein